jgi:monovalent cation:H+ antiporter, CPA1 family
MFSAEVLVTAFLTVMLVASIISHRARVPYTLILVILGIALSVISSLTFIPQGTIQQIVSQMEGFFSGLTGGQQGGLFVGLVVPPLLFEAMIHVRSSDLRAVIRPSVMLATIGVIISTVIVGFILWKIAHLPYLVSFLFAAIISPTDVATVLEVFRNAKVPSKLSTLMDTEAAFNDATGIAVFSVILASSTLGKVSLPSAVSSFAILFAGGALIGLVVAFLAEVLASWLTDKLTQTILTIFAVYGSYALASSVGVSGLIAVTIVGLYFGNFTIRTTLNPSTRETINLFWEVAAFLGNSIAFLFIGFSTNIINIAASIGSILLAYLAVTAARAASVYPILTIFNRFSEKIPMKWRNVSMLGGMRGALSIALAVSIPAAVLSTSDESELTTLVLGVAFISISLQAAILYRYIKSRFPAEQENSAESLNARLSRSASAIQSLERLRAQGGISDEEFATQLENDREELQDLMREINRNLDPRSILRQRAAELYSSMLNSPVLRAKSVFRPDKDLKEKKLETDKKDPKESEKEKPA